MSQGGLEGPALYIAARCAPGYSVELNRAVFLEFGNPTRPSAHFTHGLKILGFLARITPAQKSALLPYSNPQGSEDSTSSLGKLLAWWGHHWAQSPITSVGHRAQHFCLR